MAQTDSSELALQPSEEAELRRKLPKMDEDVLAAVPGDLQLMVMSDDEEEPAPSVQPIREDPSDPVPWFWCRGDLGGAPNPFNSMARGAPLGRSRGRSFSGASLGPTLGLGRSWSRGRPRLRSRGRGASGDVSLCRFCGRGFKFRSALEMHMRSHTGERPYTCSFCGRGFSLKGNLKTHLKTHLNGPEPDLNQFIVDRSRTPPISPLQTPPLPQLQTPPLPQPQTPPLPQIQKTSLPLLQASPLPPLRTPPMSPLLTPPLTPLRTPPLNPHQFPPFQSQSRSESRPEPRPELRLDSRQESSLDSRAESSLESKPLQCPVCSKTFSWRSTLSVHMRVHTGERPYPCTLCDKRFSLKGNLKDHMRRHMLEKRHNCAFCGLGFDHEATLLNHMAIHTSGEDGGVHRGGGAKSNVHVEGVAKSNVHGDKPKPFHLLGFDNEQPNLSHLTEHSAGEAVHEASVHEDRRVHGDMSVHEEEEGIHSPSEDKLFCPFCGLQFEHKSLLLQHISVHTGEEGVQESVTGGQSAHDDEDDDDDEGGEEEVFFAITVQ